MSNTQQEVIIYKEGALTTAPRKFEKDLKKRQAEGWRLISVTPTKQVLGRVAQLTAIYERESTPVDRTLPTDGYPANVYTETIPVANDPYLSKRDEQVSHAEPTHISSDMPTPYALVPPPPPSPPLPYSKTIFLGLILITILSFIGIGVSESFSQSSHLSGIGEAIFVGVFISLIIMDTKGFFTLHGLLRWRQMRNNTRTGMGCLFFLLFPIFLIIYLVRAGMEVFSTNDPLFSKQWDAPEPMKKRAKTGIITGTVVAFIFVLVSLFAPATSAASTSTDVTPATTQATVANASTSTPTPTAQPKPTPTPKPKLTPKIITYAHFDDGTYIVGKDIQPGTYRIRMASTGCYYARLKGFDGTVDDIIANDNTDVPAVVTISATDKGFQSSNCGTWTKM